MKISSANYNSKAYESVRQDPHEEEESIVVKVVTNANAIPDLFDFTSKKNKLKKFKAFESIVLGTEKRRPVCVGVSSDVRELEKVKDRQYMLSVTKTPREEVLYPFQVDVPGRFIDIESYPLRPIWLVLGSLKTSFGDKQLGFELSIGDRIKMGREEYRIKEMRQWLNEDKANVLMTSTFFQSHLGRLAAPSNLRHFQAEGKGQQPLLQVLPTQNCL